MLFAAETWPFTVATFLMLLIAVIEGLAMVVGANLSEWLQQALPDPWDAIHGPFDNILGWLHVGKVPLLIDSGVRRGVDALKAVAMGARAVAIGRAVLFGAAVAGESGVRHALQILTDELALAMKFSGVAKIQNADQSILNASSIRGGK